MISENDNCLQKLKEKIQAALTEFKDQPNSEEMRSRLSLKIQAVMQAYILENPPYEITVTDFDGEKLTLSISLSDNLCKTHLNHDE